MSFYLAQSPRLVKTLIIIAAVFVALVWWHKYQLKDVEPKSAAALKYLIDRDCGIHYTEIKRLRCFYFSIDGFKLPVVLIEPKESLYSREQRELLVQLPGGPGQGNMTSEEEIQYWLDWFKKNNVSADVLLFDPRGTGGSLPAVECPELEELTKSILGEDVSPRAEVESLYLETEKCLARHAAIDLRLFATKTHAQDAVKIAEALGYQNIHLWGTSYGTRVALVAAHHPKVRSLILDSAYPLSNGLISEWPALYQQSFSLHDTALQRIKPDLGESYFELYRRVQQRLGDGERLEAENWEDNKKYPIFLNRYRLLELSFSVLYSSWQYESYYQGLLDYADTGDVSESFQQVLDNFVSNLFAEGFSQFVYVVTECIDNPRETELSLQLSLQDIVDYQDYFSLFIEFDTCKLVPEYPDLVVSADDYSNKPTLIVAGEFDPVTPVNWAIKLNESLPNSQLFIVENSGHGALYSDICRWGFLPAFLSDPGQPLESTCDQKAAWQ